MDREARKHDARHIANALISRGVDVGRPFDPLQVIKMTYLCHGWMLGLYHRPMSKQTVAAWRYGPVIPVVYHGVKRYGRNRILSPVRGPLRLGPSSTFDHQEEDLIDQVIDVYGGFSGIALSAMTHVRGSPWHETWHKKGEKAEIPDDLIEEYFVAAAVAGNPSHTIPDGTNSETLTGACSAESSGGDALPRGMTDALSLSSTLCESRILPFSPYDLQSSFCESQS